MAILPGTLERGVNVPPEVHRLVVQLLEGRLNLDVVLLEGHALKGTMDRWSKGCVYGCGYV